MSTTYFDVPDGVGGTIKVELITTDTDDALKEKTLAFMDQVRQEGHYLKELTVGIPQDAQGEPTVAAAAEPGSGLVLDGNREGAVQRDDFKMA